MNGEAVVTNVEVVATNAQAVTPKIRRIAEAPDHNGRNLCGFY
jgi:hypothetical protein